MTFLEGLQSHKGGLIRLKTELYWYDGGWDGVPGRVCLVLDAVAPAVATSTTAATAVAVAVAVAPAVAPPPPRAAALLLIEDRPQWIWVSQEDVELIA